MYSRVYSRKSLAMVLLKQNNKNAAQVLVIGSKSCTATIQFHSDRRIQSIRTSRVPSDSMTSWSLLIDPSHRHMRPILSCVSATGSCCSAPQHHVLEPTLPFSSSWVSDWGASLLWASLSLSWSLLFSRRNMERKRVIRITFGEGSLPGV